MKTGESEVKSKGKVLEQKATYNIYDTVDEAVQSEGAADILAKINAQTKTNSLNSIREGANEKVGKKKLETIAMSRITSDEWGQVAGDVARIKALVEQKMQEVEVELADAAKNEAAVA